MPITLTKHLKLLTAAEAALTAAAQLETLIDNQLAVAIASGNWENALRELAAIGKVEFALPAGTRQTIEMERQFYSPTRLGINRRAKRSQERRRKREAADKIDISPMMKWINNGDEEN